MKSLIFTILFFLFGILCAYGCLYFSLLPTDSYNPHIGEIPINQNAGLSSIAMAILAVGSFIAAAMTIKRKNNP